MRKFVSSGYIKTQIPLVGSEPQLNALPRINLPRKELQLNLFLCSNVVAFRPPPNTAMQLSCGACPAFSRSVLASSRLLRDGRPADLLRDCGRTNSNNYLQLYFVHFIQRATYIYNTTLLPHKPSRQVANEIGIPQCLKQSL